MIKRTRKCDILKEAKEFEETKKGEGFQTAIHSHREHLSYKGRNKVFYDVDFWKEGIK